MPSASFVALFVRRSALFSFLATALPGQQPTPSEAAAPAVVVALATDLGLPNVWLDEPGDGRIWVRGRDYKASFGHGQFTFVPFLGADAPRNHPLVLQLVDARCGARPLPLRADEPARRHGQRCWFDRGGWTEVYDLRLEHVEQSFVFAERPGQGDLVLTSSLTTSLCAEHGHDGTLRFVGERGGVAIGAAVAIDATGVRTPLRTECVGDELVLTVPAACLAAATYPLVVDPVFQTIALTAAGWPLPNHDPDIAYTSAGGGLYVAVKAEDFSAADQDVRFVVLQPDGTLVVDGFLDNTMVSWRTPRIATNAAGDQLLCVVRREGIDIAARPIDIVSPVGGPLLTLPFPFSVHASATAVDPDVGGDASPTASLPGNYCVCWSDSGLVQWTLVRTDRTVVTPGGNVANSLLAVASHPSLSKSCGTLSAGTQEWVLVWEQFGGVGNQNVYGRRIGSNGSYHSGAFAIDTSPWSDTRPQVSSPTDAHGVGSHWLCVWQRAYPQTALQNAHTDLFGSIHVGSASLTGITNLSSLLLRPQGFATNPSVDTDGIRFAVAWSEQASVFTPDLEPMVATVHLTGNDTLDVTAYAELLQADPAVDDHLQVAAERSGGGSPSTGYALAWDVTQTTPFEQDAEAAFYRGHSDLPSTSYFASALPGCGAIQVVGSGIPALGQTFRLDVQQAQGVPWMLVGESVAPIAVCGACELGVDPLSFLMIQSSGFELTVPPVTSLIGAMLACQAADLYVPGGCGAEVLGFEFVLSNELVVVVL